MKPMRERKIQRILASLVLLSFTYSTVVWSAPTGASIQLATPQAVDGIRVSSLIGDLQIPESLGAVDERHLGSQGETYSVIHLQDAHASLDAQHSIEKILDLLVQDHGIDIVFVEGAVEALEAKNLKWLENEKSNEALVELLAKDGLLSGAELYLSKEINQPISMLGVESLDLYRENLNSFREVYEHKNDTEAYLEKTKVRISSLASNVFSKTLKEFFRQWVFYQDNQGLLMRHLDTLSVYAKEQLQLDLTDARQQLEWPQLVRYNKLLEAEETLNTEKANDELRDLVQWLAVKQASSAYREAVSHYTAGKGFEINKMSPEAQALFKKGIRYFIEGLYEQTREQGFDFRTYLELSKAWGISILQEEMDAGRLYQEVQKVTEKLLQKMAPSEKEKALLKIYQDYLLLSKAMKLELTYQEEEEVQKKRVSVRPSSLEKRMTDLQRKTPTEPQPIDLKMQSQAEQAFEKAIIFYRQARGRDQVIFDNMMKQMKNLEKHKAVLITGGFHTQGISQRMREHHLSYVQITPHISEIGSNKAYVDAMTLNGAANARESTIPVVRRAQPKKFMAENFPSESRFFERRLITHRSAVLAPKKTALSQRSEVRQKAPLQTEGEAQGITLQQQSSKVSENLFTQILRWLLMPISLVMGLISGLVQSSPKPRAGYTSRYNGSVARYIEREEPRVVLDSEFGEIITETALVGPAVAGGSLIAEGEAAQTYSLSDPRSGASNGITGGYQDHGVYIYNSPVTGASTAAATSTPRLQADFSVNDHLLIHFVGNNLEIRDSQAQTTRTYEAPFLLKASGVNAAAVSPDNQWLVVADKQAVLYAFRLQGENQWQGFQLAGLDPSDLSGMGRAQSNYVADSLTFSDDHNIQVTLHSGSIVPVYLSDTDFRYAGETEVSVLANQDLSADQVSTLPITAVTPLNANTTLGTQRPGVSVFNYQITTGSTQGQTGVNLELEHPFTLTEIGGSIHLGLQGNADQVRLYVTGTRLNSNFGARVGLYLTDISAIDGRGATITPEKLAALGLDPEKPITSMVLLVGNAHAGGGILPVSGQVTLSYAPHENALRKIADITAMTEEEMRVALENYHELGAGTVTLLSLNVDESLESPSLEGVRARYALRIDQRGNQIVESTLGFSEGQFRTIGHTEIIEDVLALPDTTPAPVQQGTRTLTNPLYSYEKVTSRGPAGTSASLYSNTVFKIFTAPNNTLTASIYGGYSDSRRGGGESHSITNPDVSEDGKFVLVGMSGRSFTSTTGAAPSQSMRITSLEDPSRHVSVGLGYEYLDRVTSIRFVRDTEDSIRITYASGAERTEDASALLNAKYSPPAGSQATVSNPDFYYKERPQTGVSITDVYDIYNARGEKLFSVTKKTANVQGNQLETISVPDVSSDGKYLIVGIKEQSLHTGHKVQTTGVVIYDIQTGKAVAPRITLLERDNQPIEPNEIPTEIRFAEGSATTIRVTNSRTGDTDYYDVVARLNSRDTNKDGHVTPIDALRVINHLNSTTELPYNEALDVNKDGFVTPLDALMIINRLNETAGQLTPEGEAAYEDLSGLTDADVQYRQDGNSTIISTARLTHIITPRAEGEAPEIRTVLTQAEGEGTAIKNYFAGLSVIAGTVPAAYEVHVYEGAPYTSPVLFTMPLPEGRQEEVFSAVQAGGINYLVIDRGNNTNEVDVIADFSGTPFTHRFNQDAHVTGLRALANGDLEIRTTSADQKDNVIRVLRGDQVISTAHISFAVVPTQTQGTLTPLLLQHIPKIGTQPSRLQTNLVGPGSSIISKDTKYLSVSSQGVSVLAGEKDQGFQIILGTGVTNAYSPATPRLFDPQDTLTLNLEAIRQNQNPGQATDARVPVRVEIVGRQDYTVPGITYSLSRQVADSVVVMVAANETAVIPLSAFSHYDFSVPVQFISIINADTVPLTITTTVENYQIPQIGVQNTTLRPGPGEPVELTGTVQFFDEARHQLQIFEGNQLLVEEVPVTNGTFNQDLNLAAGKHDIRFKVTDKEKGWVVSEFNTIISVTPIAGTLQPLPVGTQLNGLSGNRSVLYDFNLISSARPSAADSFVMSLGGGITPKTPFLSADFGGQLVVGLDQSTDSGAILPTSIRIHVRGVSESGATLPDQDYIVPLDSTNGIQTYAIPFGSFAKITQIILLSNFGQNNAGSSQVTLRLSNTETQEFRAVSPNKTVADISLPNDAAGNAPTINVIASSGVAQQTDVTQTGVHTSFTATRAGDYLVQQYRYAVPSNWTGVSEVHVGALKAATRSDTTPQEVRLEIKDVNGRTATVSYTDFTLGQEQILSLPVGTIAAIAERQKQSGFDITKVASVAVVHVFKNTATGTVDFDIDAVQAGAVLTPSLDFYNSDINAATHTSLLGVNLIGDAHIGLDGHDAVTVKNNGGFTYTTPLTRAQLEADGTGHYIFNLDATATGPVLVTLTSAAEAGQQPIIQTFILRGLDSVVGGGQLFALPINLPSLAHVEVRSLNAPKAGEAPTIYTLTLRSQDLEYTTPDAHLFYAESIGVPSIGTASFQTVAPSGGIAPYRGYITPLGSKAELTDTSKDVPWFVHGINYDNTSTTKPGLQTADWSQTGQVRFYLKTSETSAKIEVKDSLGGKALIEVKNLVPGYWQPIELDTSALRELSERQGTPLTLNKIHTLFTVIENLPGGKPHSIEMATRPSLNPHDTTLKNTVSPLSVLVIINLLNDPAALAALPPSARLVYDANRDGLVSPIDALVIINELNRSTENITTSSASNPSYTLSRYVYLVSQGGLNNRMVAILQVTDVNNGVKKTVRSISRPGSGALGPADGYTDFQHVTTGTNPAVVVGVKETATSSWQTEVIRIDDANQKIVFPGTPLSVVQSGRIATISFAGVNTPPISINLDTFKVIPATLVQAEGEAPSTELPPSAIPMANNPNLYYQVGSYQKSRTLSLFQVNEDQTVNQMRFSVLPEAVSNVSNVQGADLDSVTYDEVISRLQPIDFDALSPEEDSQTNAAYRFGFDLLLPGVGGLFELLNLGQDVLPDNLRRSSDKVIPRPQPMDQGTMPQDEESQTSEAYRFGLDALLPDLDALYEMLDLDLDALTDKPRRRSEVREINAELRDYGRSLPAVALTARAAFNTLSETIPGELARKILDLVAPKIAAQTQISQKEIRSALEKRMAELQGLVASELLTLDAEGSVILSADHLDKRQSVLLAMIPFMVALASPERHQTFFFAGTEARDLKQLVLNPQHSGLTPREMGQVSKIFSFAAPSNPEGDLRQHIRQERTRGISLTASISPEVSKAYAAVLESILRNIEAQTEFSNLKTADQVAAAAEAFAVRAYMLLNLAKYLKAEMIKKQSEPISVLVARFFNNLGITVEDIRADGTFALSLQSVSQYLSALKAAQTALAKSA